MTHEKAQRPDWEEYFLNIADEVGTRGSCDRGRCGAVIARDNRILATGYVGAPSGMPHCDEVGHEYEWRLDRDPASFTCDNAMQYELRKHCVRTIHAEANAILAAARFGVSLESATIYTKMFPCFICASSIVAVGIVKVVARHGYQSAERSKITFDQIGVEWKIVNDYLHYKP